jgi:hypothetical protein
MTKYKYLNMKQIIRDGDEMLDLDGGPWVPVSKKIIGQVKLVAGNWLRRPLKIKEARKPAPNSQSHAICAVFRSRKRCAWFCDRYCKSTPCMDTRKHAGV